MAVNHRSGRPEEAKGDDEEPGDRPQVFSFVGFVQRSPGHLIQALHKQPSHDVKSNNRQPMDRGTYHRASGLFGFGYRAINHRSGRPNGAQGESPGQSEAPPWDWCARHNPSPERAEPAARKPMCYVSPFQGLGELGRRRAQVAGVPRVALRSTLGYLIMPRWGERSRGKNSRKKHGDCPRVFSSLLRAGACDQSVGLSNEFELDKSFLGHIIVMARPILPTGSTLAKTSVVGSRRSVIGRFAMEFCS
jgi:hypothetical protein